MPNKDQKLKNSLIEYLFNSKDERLWQAIRNWSGHHFIFIYDGGLNRERVPKGFIDTFNWENKK